MVILKLLVLVFLDGCFASEAKFLLPAAIKYAIANSFNSTADELNIIIETDFDENKDVFTDAIGNILRENWNFRLQIHVNNEGTQLSGDYNLWFIDSYAAFKRLLPWIHAYHRDSQLFFLVVLKNSTVKIHYIQEIQQIFSDFLLLMIANVNVLIETDSEEVLFYTFYPYQELACLSTKPVLIHRFDNNSIELKKQLFPPKADNFRGCPLRIVTRNELIVRMGNPDLPKGLANYEMSILEEVMVKEFVSRMNFTLEIYNFKVLPSADSELPLTPGKSDLLIGFIRNGPYYNYWYSKSPPYYYHWLVIALYPQPDTFRTQAWILTPFHLTTWSYIIASLTFVTGCIVLSKTRRIKSLLSSFRLHFKQFGGLEVISFLIGGSIQHLPNQNFLRFYFIILSLAALVLRTAYLGKLFDAFMGQTMLIPPRSIKELFAENYTIYAHPSYKSLIDELSDKEYFNFQYLSQNIKNSDLLETDKKKAYIVAFIYIYTFFTAKERKNLIMEMILGGHICIFFQKHSFIMPKINEIIIKLDEAGILHYFRKNFENLNAAPDSSDHQEPEPLGLERFEYIFYLASGFYGISCLVFILELLWHWNKN